MAIWLEFHDSTLSAVNQTAKDVEVVLDAYVHRWEALGDSWKGTGWMQPVRILISEVDGRSGVPILPVDISDGHVAVATIIHDDLLSLPFNASGEVRLWLQLTNADVIEFSGRTWEQTKVSASSWWPRITTGTRFDYQTRNFTQSST